MKPAPRRSLPQVHAHVPTAPASASAGLPPQVLVLVGGGPAHLRLLQQLAAQPLAGVQVVLMEPQAQPLYCGMLPDLVAGRAGREACSFPLEALAQAARVQWRRCSVQALDALHQTLTLDDGSALRYDWLSVNTAAPCSHAQIEQHIPGARGHALFVEPLEGFAALWPQVADMGRKRPLRITLAHPGLDTGDLHGPDGLALALAFAVRQCLPKAAVTLLTGPHTVGAHLPPKARQLLQAALAAQRITPIQDLATAVQAHEVQLQSGNRLASDVLLLLASRQPPAWLATSALALDAQGFLAVDNCQRSTSHPNVFAAGDASAYQDAATKRCAHAAQANAALSGNLLAAMAGAPLIPLTPSRMPDKHLALLPMGDGSALACYGNWAMGGRWAGWLKRWMDGRYLQQFGPLSARRQP